MPSTFFKTQKVVTTVDKLARVYPKSLPRLDVPVRHKPILLKHPYVKTSEGRLLTIGRLVTDLFRDERIETRDYYAHAIRPYAERIIQLAVEYGDCHKPTMEVCSYYLHEKDLIHKLFKVYVPRYRNYSSAFTSVYQLPAYYGLRKPKPRSENDYVFYRPVVLEMKGNPYPPVVPRRESHQNSILNVLLEEARKYYSLKRHESVNNEDISDNQPVPDEDVLTSVSTTETVKTT